MIAVRGHHDFDRSGVLKSWLVKALVGTQLVGVVVGKAEEENSVNRGYIAMLAVETSYRRLNIGKLNEDADES